MVRILRVVRELGEGTARVGGQRLGREGPGREGRPEALRLAAVRCLLNTVALPHEDRELRRCLSRARAPRRESLEERQTDDDTGYTPQKIPTRHPIRSP